MIRHARPRSIVGTFVALGLWGAVWSSGGPLLAGPPVPRVAGTSIPRGLVEPPRTVGRVDGRAGPGVDGPGPAGRRRLDPSGPLPPP